MQLGRSRLLCQCFRGAQVGLVQTLSGGALITLFVLFRVPLDMAQAFRRSSDADNHNETNHSGLRNVSTSILNILIWCTLMLVAL